MISHKSENVKRKSEKNIAILKITDNFCMEKAKFVIINQ
jgi:hypothetical protein